MKVNKYVVIGIGCLTLSFAVCRKVELGPLPTLAPTPTASVTSEVLSGQAEEHVTPQVTSKAEIGGVWY